MGHEDQFSPSGLNASCRFGQATFAGTNGERQDAPEAAMYGGRRFNSHIGLFMLCELSPSQAAC
jgi:hypothetical protein